MKSGHDFGNWYLKLLNTCDTL